MQPAAVDLAAVVVDEVDGTGEAVAIEVVEDGPADGALATGRSDQRDRSRLEEAGDGRGGRDPVALLEALSRLGRQRGGDLDDDPARLRAGDDREAGIAEH